MKEAIFWGASGDFIVKSQKSELYFQETPASRNIYIKAVYLTNSQSLIPPGLEQQRQARAKPGFPSPKTLSTRMSASQT
jgi:hypothetical protein